MALSRWKPHATFSLTGQGSISLKGETYCNQCLRHFVSTEALEEHFLDSKFHFYCRLCTRHFKDHRSLENHHKTSRNHHHCEKCNLAVATALKLTEHYIEKHDFCVLCQKLFDSETKLHEHLTSTHHVCWDCKVFYTTPKELKDHYARLKKHPWCSICKEAFFDDEEFTRHLTISKNHYYCIQCKRDHSTVEHLAIHFESAEHKSHKLLKCPYCPRTFDAHSSLVIHFEIGTCAGKNRRKDCKVAFSKEKAPEKKPEDDITRYYLPYNGYVIGDSPKPELSKRPSTDCLECHEPGYRYINGRSLDYVNVEPYDFNRGRHRYTYQSTNPSPHPSKSRSRSRHSTYTRPARSQSRHSISTRRSQSRHRDICSDSSSSSSDSEDWEDVLRQSRLATNRSWNGSRFECAVCCDQFKTLERLNRHLANAHDNDVYVCDGRKGCGRTFPSIRRLVDHVENDEKCGVGKWRAYRAPSVEDLTHRFRFIDY